MIYRRDRDDDDAAIVGDLSSAEPDPKRRQKLKDWTPPEKRVVCVSDSNTGETCIKTAEVGGEEYPREWMRVGSGMIDLETMQ